MNHLSGVRRAEFDVVKAFAIWLVVLAHCIQTFVPDFEQNTLWLMVVMFHMPLFMFISGYFFYPSIERYSLGQYIRRRFMRLYLPSLVWGLFNVLLIGFSKIRASKPLEIDYFLDILFTGMWFLTVLFILNVIGAFIEKLSSKYKWLVWCGVYLIVYFLPSLWMVNEVKFLLPFFVLGMFVKLHDIKRVPLLAFLISLIVFVYFLFGVYDFDFSLYQMKDNVLDLDYHVKSLVRMVSGLCGILLTFYVFDKIRWKPEVTRWLTDIGMCTLPIYVMHQKFLLPFHAISSSMLSWLMAFVCSVILLFLCRMIYSLLSKNRLLALLLFGEKR